MKKAIKDLKPGDIYFDSLGLEVKVVSVSDVPYLGIPRSYHMSKVTYKTHNGYEMFFHSRSDRMVEVKE